MALEVSGPPNVATQPISRKAAAQLQFETQPTAQGVESTDRVTLTATAERLRQGSNGARSPIDEKRLESIRQKIASGSYQVDASRVADRLLRFESSLTGTS
ncbi:negative regulator of flagellin synthesis FlgM [Gammaproteobacteria bacterium]